MKISEINVPERLVRMTVGLPTIDKEKRTIRNVVATRKLARDGGIVVPAGILKRFYEQNPIVCAVHNRSVGSDPRSTVIGRSLGLENDSTGMVSTTQFADTELGREYAYLYGLNDKNEVYMRAWSFGWNTLEQEIWTLDEARRWLGQDWEEDVISMWDERFDQVWAAIRSEMHEYSAVPVGADRGALSRAFGQNVRVAGELITSLDLQEAAGLLDELRIQVKKQDTRVSELERQIQAIRRDGASAAANGDSDAILREVRALTASIIQ